MTGMRGQRPDGRGLQLMVPLGVLLAVGVMMVQGQPLPSTTTSQPTSTRAPQQQSASPGPPSTTVSPMMLWMDSILGSIEEVRAVPRGRHLPAKCAQDLYIPECQQDYRKRSMKPKGNIP